MTYIVSSGALNSTHSLTDRYSQTSEWTKAVMHAVSIWFLLMLTERALF